MISCPPLTRQTAARSSKTRAFVLRRNQTVAINDKHVLSTFYLFAKWCADAGRSSLHPVVCIQSLETRKPAGCIMLSIVWSGLRWVSGIMQLSPILMLLKTCTNLNHKLHLWKSKQTHGRTSIRKGRARQPSTAGPPSSSQRWWGGGGGTAGSPHIARSQLPARSPCAHFLVNVLLTHICISQYRSELLSVTICMARAPPQE